MQYRERLEEEVGKYYNGKESDGEDLKKMEFTHAFIKETLRMASPAKTNFYRIALKDHSLGEYKILKGTTTAMEWIMNDFNPKYYEDPERFYPERWLEGKEKVEFMAFGSGPRNCVGQQLSWIEGKMVLAEFLKRFRGFEMCGDCKLRFTYRFVYGPLDTLYFKLQK